MTNLTIEPLTPGRWPDLEKLFGKRGACGGCWCMTWRLTRKAYELQKGEPNRKAFKAIVDSGSLPGLLAYRGEEPIGWCAVAPRDDYPTLDRSRILKRVDSRPVWSIPCLFVDRRHRRQGVSVELLKAAVRFAGSRGAEIVEGYPVDPRKPDMPDLFAFTGLVSAFSKAGFHEVARRSDTRPIMRVETSRSRNS